MTLGVEHIGEILQQRSDVLATAESCTGGLVAECITNIPGASAWYAGGWVTYSNEMKMNQLGVQEEMLREYGAVSEQVAIAMCQGAILQSKATVALSTTGIAGPSGGTDIKPVGTVFIGCILAGEAQVNRYLFSGTRGEVREQTVVESFRLLGNMLSDETIL